MIADRVRMVRELRDAAKASGLEAPQPHVGGDQARFLSGLQSLRGADFDREYARQQMLAHTSALVTMRGYADKGSHANLRRVAAAAAPVIDRHQQASRQLMQSLKPSS